MSDEKDILEDTNFFCGLTKDELWSAVNMSSNNGEVKAAIRATVSLKSIVAQSNRTIYQPRRM